MCFCAHQGIPDFRSEGGLYSKAEFAELPSPESVFDIDFFQKRPGPFYKLAAELFPGEGQFDPTPAHYFIRLLDQKGLLLRSAKRS